MIKRKIYSEITNFYKNHNKALLLTGARQVGKTYVLRKFGEVDFVITYKEKVLPIEIKSGKDYIRHSAMDNVLKVPNYGIESGMVFCDGNLSMQGSLTYLPVYMLMFLKNSRSDNKLVYKLDLSGIS